MLQGTFSSQADHLPLISMLYVFISLVNCTASTLHPCIQGFSDSNLAGARFPTCQVCHDLALTEHCTARAIREGGLHQGFDSLVWCVVGLQVFGGLIVGMVVKYADNIQKNFANALSVIFTVLGAIPLFGQVPSAWFILGVGFTMLSVFMYQQSMSPVSCLVKGLQACAGDVSKA